MAKQTASPGTPDEPPAEKSAAPAKAVISSPFDGLKDGGSYVYTRAQWPAGQQVGDKVEPLKKTSHPATVKGFPKLDEKGQIVHELRVQLNGTGRFYSLKELPADATLTEA